MKYIKYFIGILIVLIPCVIAILIYNDKITQNSPLYYKQGVDFYNNGDYQNAYYNFGKIKWISPLYPMALYKQAKSAQKVGDYNMAAVKYKLFLEKSPNSIFSKAAQKNLAKCYFYSKQYDEAKILFEEIKQKLNKKGTEEDYFLALLEKNNNKDKAAIYLKNYLEGILKNEKADKTFFLRAAEELSSLGIELNNEDKKILGIVYYKNGKYDKAVKYLSKLPLDMCWDYLVLANHNAGNKVIAKKLIESGLSLYSQKINENNLHDIYDIYTSYMPGAKLNNWRKMHKIVKDNSLKGEDYVMYKLAGMVNKENALALYKEIAEKYPDGNYAPEALWHIFWDKYSKKDYKNAEQLAIKHLQNYQQAKSAPGMLFWFAKTLEKENKISDAHNYLSKLAAKYPDDYYGLRAEYIINKKDNFWKTDKTKKIPPPKEEIEFPITLSHLDIKDLKLINTILEMGDYEIWDDADFENPIVKSWIEFKKNNKSRSIVIARDAIAKMEIKPPYMSASYKLAYPRYWIDEINIAGQKLELDPYLIIALIREESYFNENAKSISNAAGLMQLMPATANYMISMLSDNIPSYTNLENPRMNMYLGCNYLKYLYDRFNNDLFVVAAYNGGEGSVNKWQRIYSTADYDEFIENIPFDETRNYVKKVFRSYHLYRKIYE